MELLFLFFLNITFADKLFSQEEFFDAITEYKRLLYTYPDSNAVKIWRKKLALSYAMLKDYENSFNYIDSTSPDKLERLITFVHYGIPANDSSPFSSLLKTIKNIQNIPYNLQVSFINDSISQMLEKEIEEIMRKWKNPNTAKYLSCIIPGAGMFYLGNIYEGILSLAINITTGYFTYKAIVEKRYIDAALIGQFGFLRFYSGGTNRVYSITEMKNNKLKKELIIKMINKYLEFYPHDSLYVKVLLKKDWE